MFKTIVNAWKIKDIRTKILYTLLLILLYRVGCYIPIPGVNVEGVASSLEQYVAIGGFMNMFTGGAFSNYALFGYKPLHHRFDYHAASCYRNPRA